MHVIALENEPSSLRGGIEINLFDTCRGLVQRGHQVSLLYVKAGNLLEQYQEFCTHTVPVKGYRINRSQAIASLTNFWADIHKLPHLENSLVYSSHYYDSFFGFSLALARQIPFVCHFHLPPPKKLGWQWEVGLKRANQFIATSNQTKSAWVDRGFKATAINVVHNGINPDLFSLGEDRSIARKNLYLAPDTKAVTYVGRIDREKGLETLLKAHALLLQSGVQAKLLIAGKPVSHSSPKAGEDYVASLKQLANNLGIEQQVDFLGHIAHPASIYQISDVTVLPSLFAEPFGRTIIESMACGTPIVASRVGGIPEILTGEFEKGLFESGNEVDLFQTLNQVLRWRSNPDLGQRCREHVVQNFSLDKMVDGIEAVLTKVVSF